MRRLSVFVCSSAAAVVVARVTVHVARRVVSVRRARCGVAITRRAPAAYEGPGGATLLRMSHRRRRRPTGGRVESEVSFVCSRHFTEDSHEVRCLKAMAEAAADKLMTKGDAKCVPVRASEPPARGAADESQRGRGRLRSGRDALR